MKRVRIVRTVIVVCFMAILAGSIGYQNAEKEAQVECIMTAAKQLGKLVNLHYRIVTTDESGTDGLNGVSTEVWADLDSEKWAAVYSSIEGETQTIYQSQLYDGETSYGINDTVETWTELAQTVKEIPYYETLHTFYYEEEDFTDVTVKTKDDTTVIEAALSEEALEKVKEDAVDSANQTYLSYMESGDEASMAAAELLLECAKQMQITKVQVSYTIDEEGMLGGSTFTEYYSLPAILATESGSTLGDMEEHVVTTTREVLGYNNKDTTTILHNYLGQVKD